MKKGDIVLLPFPFTDLHGNKIRPAIVLIESPLDVTVCFISTQLYIINTFDFILTPNGNNRLKKESAVKLNKISTIEKELVIGKIGELTSTELEILNFNLRGILKL
jgi:mRNA interferase MazF